MRHLHLDIFSGISGDMFLGALLDLGISQRELNQELAKLNLTGYQLKIQRRHKASIEGVQVQVVLTGSHQPADTIPVPHPGSAGEGGHRHDPGESRNYADIRKLIEDSSVDPWVQDRAKRVFHRIAVAEGKVHGLPPEKVHFHEVGALDSIVDIVGACIGLNLLGRPRVTSGPVVEGTGFVLCAHGRFPIPTTATLEILGARGVPVQQCEEPHELVTPTGAALLAEFAESFGLMQNLVADRIGYGLGTRNLASRPNVLRAILSETGAPDEQCPDWETDSVVVLETNLDDISAELLGHLVEKGLRRGALDIFHTAVQMKKNRPGTLFTVLCAPDDADTLAEWILTETSAFGVRRSTWERRKLARDWVRVDTIYGTVRVKIGRLRGRIVQVAPEFSECESVAAQAGVPVRLVYDAALRAAPGLEA